MGGNLLLDSLSRSVVENYRLSVIQPFPLRERFFYGIPGYICLNLVSNTVSG